MLERKIREYITRSGCGDDFLFTEIIAAISEKKKLENENANFFNLSLDMICIAGMDGFFKRINSAFTNILGWSEEYLLLKPFLFFVHPEDVQGTLNEMKKLAEGVLSINFENRFKCQDGTYRNLIWKTSLDPISGLLYAVAHDITESKQTKEYLFRKAGELQAVLSVLPDLYLLFDKKGKILDYRAPKNFLLYAPPEVFLGKNVEEIFPPNIVKMVQEAISTVVSGESSVTIEYVLEINGKSSDFEARFLSLLGNQVVTLIRDITERKQFEEDLKKAKKLAQESSKFKSEFLANMSHEIRTPMNAILGMAELLQETALTEEQTRYVKIFTSAGENLLYIINDILDLSKIEAGKLDLENVCFNLGDALNLVKEIMAFKSSEKKNKLLFNIATDFPLDLIGDAVRIKQIILNLIGNAVKFTNEGEITVSVQLEKKTTEAVRLKFSVRDTGIGIPENKLKQIFESFSQVDISTTRKYGGTGLGLTISKYLVEMMGGNICVESKEGEGSIFFFTVEFKIDEQCQLKKENLLIDLSKNTPKFEESDVQSLNILLVDDNEDNRNLIIFYLKKTLHQIDTAENGQIAVDKFQAGKYDLVLMDMEMPIKDGLIATREIREWEKGQGIKYTVILSLTANAMLEHKQKSIDAGCDGHLTKPIKKQILLDAINKYTKIS